jgi:hypothetical protein
MSLEPAVCLKGNQIREMILGISFHLGWLNLGFDNIHQNLNTVRVTTRRGVKGVKIDLITNTNIVIR